MKLPSENIRIVACPTLCRGVEYRTIGHERMIEHLMQHGFAHDISQGRVDEARAVTERALERWLGLGLKHALSPTGKMLFDPTETMNFFISAGVLGKDHFWQDHYVQTVRRLVTDFHQDQMPSGLLPDPSRLEPKRFSVRLERDFDLTVLKVGTRVRLRLPLPIEDDSLSNLHLQLQAPEDAVTSQTVGRYDAAIVVDERKNVTLSATANFIAHTGSRASTELTAAERLVYTNQREDMIRINDRIRGLAQSLTRRKKDVWSKVMAIYDYLIDNFYFGCVAYYDLDANSPTTYPLESGVYDCQLAASLFCALCRAEGIPSRVVSGYWLYTANPINHFWAEMWVDSRGWVAIDFASWHLSLAGRDPVWRNVFVGDVDYRMKTQVLPGIFTGPSSVKFPTAWHRLVRASEGELEISYEDAVSGALVYRDRIAVLNSPGHVIKPTTHKP